MSSAFSFNFSFGEESGAAEESPAHDAPAVARASEKSSVIPWNDIFAAHECLDCGFGLKRVLIEVDDVVGSHLDVVPGKYEGGAKLWECTRDLLQLLYNESNASLVSSKRVLDMGCGAGILGCAALVLGAESVVFQDLNAEVLTHITQANVRLNVGKTEAANFLASSWAALQYFPDMQARKADVILASEILYNVDYYADICKVFEGVLSADGVVFIATKRFYYGVGGGVPQFVEFLTKHAPQFQCETIQSFVDGKSMIRDILKITRR